MYQKIIYPPAPFDFHHLFDRLRQSSNRILYKIEPEQTITRLFLIDDHPVLLRVKSNGAVEQPQIILTAFHARNQQDADSVFTYATHVFSLNRTLLPFYQKIADTDPILYQLTQHNRGVNLLLEPGVFEAMVLSIIGQQVNLTFAANLKHALVTLVNQSFDWEGQTYYAFPSPERVAALAYADLRGLKFSQRKAEYVIDFARLVADGKFRPEEIERLSNEEAIGQMIHLRGIGRWTAESVLLFGLGRPDLLPAADIGLRNAVQLFYGLSHQPSEAEVREYAKAWSGWESYATYYLWSALGNERQKNDYRISNPCEPKGSGRF